jgi:hypothetical protein
MSRGAAPAGVLRRGEAAPGRLRRRRAEALELPLQHAHFGQHGAAARFLPPQGVEPRGELPVRLAQRGQLLALGPPGFLEAARQPALLAPPDMALPRQPRGERGDEGEGERFQQRNHAIPIKRPILPLARLPYG